MWLTNNQEAAQRLRDADKWYESERTKAQSMPLARKIAFLRAARRKHRETYDEVSRKAREGR